MRIGFFTDTYQPQINGITYVIDIMRRQLEEMGHEVFIFAPAPMGYIEHDEHVIRFRSLKGFFYDDYLLSVFFPPRELRRASSYDLDIVQFFTPSQVGLLGCAVAKKNGIPLVAQYSTDLYEYVEHYPSTLPGIIGLLMFVAPWSVKPQKTDFRPMVGALRPRPNMTRGMWSRSVIRTTMTLLHNRCDAVIALSKKKERQMHEWLTQSPVHLIPTGVDKIPAPRGGAKKFRQEYGISPNEKVILFVGRLGPEKNIDMLVKAFRKLREVRKDIKLVLAGDGEHRSALEELSEKYGLQDQITFTGPYDRNDLGSVYASANVFVFPSRTDTQGLVLHEAAQAGVPIVMTDKNVSEMVIPGETGFFAKHTISSLSENIEKILNLPAKDYKTMSQAVQKQARQYGERKQVKKNEALYKELLPLKSEKNKLLQDITDADANIPG